MTQVVVGAAVIDAGRVLAVQRAEPPVLYGLWEFPGGKVEPGESEVGALVRECAEELGLALTVGARVGPDVPLLEGRLVLRVYAATAPGRELHLHEHLDARWLGPDDLESVEWIPADAPVVSAVRTLLNG